MPPFQSGSTYVSEKLEIAYPKLEYFESESNFTLHFHVFNSTGFPLNVSTTTCTMHLYDSQDAHILKTIMKFEDEYDYEANINTSIIKKDGAYSYIVQCLNDQQGGFVSGSFQVVNQARNKALSNGRILASVIGLGILAFFFLLLAFSLDKEDHFLLKLFAVFFSLFAIMLIPAVILNEGSRKVLGLFYQVPLWFFIIFVTYISVYLVWHWMKKSQKICDMFRIKKDD